MALGLRIGVSQLQQSDEASDTVWQATNRTLTNIGYSSVLTWYGLMKRVVATRGDISAFTFVQNVLQYNEDTI